MSYDISKDNLKSNLTFQELVELYKKDKTSAKKKSTKKSDNNVYNILEEFHTRIASEITREDFKEFLDIYVISRKESYVNKIRKYISKVYNWAIEVEILTHNPVKTISEYKNPDDIEEEVIYYTSYEWESWERTAKNDLRNNPKDIQYYMFLNVMYFMGMRTGEVRALKVEDIEGGYIRIKKTCTTVNKSEDPKGYIITSPKSKISNRTIAIPQLLQKRLDVYFKYLEARGKLRRENFLFGVDKPLQLQTIERKFKRISKMAMLPIYRPYCLRHSHATLLINSGALDYAVARRMGHTVKELRETYAHCYKTSEDNCVNIMDEIHPCSSNLKKEKSITEIINQAMESVISAMGYKDENMEWGTYYKSIDRNDDVLLWTYEKGGAENHLKVDKNKYLNIKSDIFLNL